MKKFFILTLFAAILIGTNVFGGQELQANGYKYTDDGVIIYCDIADISLNIPAEINGTKIKKIADNAFKESQIEYFDIADGIESIGKNCFENSSVCVVNIPASVKEIGDRAFYGCTDLSEVYIVSNDITFGKECFAHTDRLTFGVPCNIDLVSIENKITAAKSDGNFEFSKSHHNVAESMLEKNIYGEAIIYCNDCGEKLNTFIEENDMKFDDVSKDSWYHDYVSTAYLFGILNGKSETKFDPNANMTLAEAAKIAASIHAYLNDYKGEFKSEGGNWYDAYVSYCYNNNIIEDYRIFDWKKNATRGEMAYLFSRADTVGYEINPDVPLTDIPDVYDTTDYAYEILDLYRRGIAAGSDDKYTFYPDSMVKRSEAAAFISRILCYDMRVELAKG